MWTKVLFFCLEGVPWTGNELAGDDEENCENFQLTVTYLSHLLQFFISQRLNTLEIMSASSTESCDTSHSSSREEMEVSSAV